MCSQIASQGSLFTSDFLSETILDSTDWKGLSDASLAAFEARLANVYATFRIDLNHTEADTETDLIFPVLNALGWTATLTQQNLSVAGRDDVPDGLLFADASPVPNTTTCAENRRR